MMKKAASQKIKPRRPSSTPAPLAPAPKRVYPRGVAPTLMPARTARPTGTSKTRRTAPPKTTKRAPLETQRVGGIFSIPKKPKKTVY
jgi:hypothetical protein